MFLAFFLELIAAQVQVLGGSQVQAKSGALLLGLVRSIYQPWSHRAKINLFKSKSIYYYVKETMEIVLSFIYLVLLYSLLNIYLALDGDSSFNIFEVTLITIVSMPKLI